jgi:hypothetical protein
MKDWIVPIATLLGVIVGGSISLLNSRIQANRQEARERKKLILEKMERLHAAVNTYALKFESLWNEMIRIRDDNVPPEFKVPNNSDFQEIDVLVGFYGRELVAQANDVEAIADALIMAGLEFAAVIRPDHKQVSKIVVTFMDEKRKFEVACDRLKDQICTLSKMYI